MSFGLVTDPNPSHFPLDHLVESRPARLDIWTLRQCGALVDGAVTWLEVGQKKYRLAARTADLLVDGTPALLAWEEPMPGVDRPWFLCSRCDRRCRYLYLPELACRRCLGLDYASRHLHRQTPGVARVARLRRTLGDCDTRPFAPLPTRRQGRSRARHEELVALIQAEEARLVDYLGGVVHDLRRRIAVRKAKGQW